MTAECLFCKSRQDSYGMHRIGGYRGFAEDHGQHTGQIELCTDCANAAEIITFRDGYPIVDLDKLHRLIFDTINVRVTTSRLT